MRYRDAYPPVEPEDQVSKIIELAVTMKSKGRPLDDGFDFSLGILEYQKGAKEGSVDYIDYIQQYCGRT